jgi:RND superfamily putative drug exporter
VKGTPSTANIYLGSTPATWDIQDNQIRSDDRRDSRAQPDSADHDDHHPSLVAALVIVGTVALSLGASFGLSVLVWQDLLGIQLYWIVLALAVILLLAVGSDYNLLLIRFKRRSAPD